MDLYQLRYFLEVARRRSFTRAAEALHVSGPAVSRSVAALEASLGRRLFHRTKRRVELTAEGEALRVRAERAFDELERGRQEVLGEADAVPGMLRIASREMITNYLLPEALKAFRAAHPGTRFGLYELGPREMAEALRADRVDFGFYYSTDVLAPDLELKHLGFLRSHVYAAKSLLGRGRRRSLKETLSLPFVAPRYFGADPSLPSVDGFPDQRLKRDIRYEAEFLETHRQFVLQGLCAGVLPDWVMREDERRRRVVRLPGPPLGREIYFLKRKGRPLPRSVDDFCSAVRRILRAWG